MFKKEKDIDNPKEDITRVNSDFEMQSMTGRTTGKMKLSKSMEEAMKKYDQKKKDAEKNIPRIISDDPAELG